jgi:protease-4
MLKYLFYGIRFMFRAIGNILRKMSKVPDYVIFTLEGDYPELPQENINPLIRMFRPPKVSLLELSEQIRTVVGDSRVKGVLFLIRPLTMPLAKIDVLRGLIRELQESGKEVVTWSYSYDTRMYYLASAADRITLLPGGMLAPLGLYQEYIYMADALEKLGVKPDFIQISPYKSAVDMFTQREMSEEVRRMGNWLADATYEEILIAIANGRKIEKETAKRIIDQTPCIDQKAVDIGAIDHLVGEDGLPELLRNGKTPARLVIWEVGKKQLFHPPMKVPGKYIALMSIEGLIIDGRNGQPPVEPPIPIPIVMDKRAGDLSIVQTIRQIIADKRVAGVVVYVNSKGGSVTASESMRLALEKLGSQKPLVVVMGPVAASGGYWVSTPGKMIFAQPNTITGSIGVIMGKFADVGILKNIFLNLDSIHRGENIGIFEPAAPFTTRERTILEDHIHSIYEMFLERVTKSREMELDAVDEIGRGRVWTGRQALENGLIDSLGGVDSAVEKIRELANLDPRAPIRLFGPGKQYYPPVTERGSVLKYGVDGFRFLEGQAMCLCPLIWTERYGRLF